MILCLKKKRRPFRVHCWRLDYYYPISCLIYTHLFTSCPPWSTCPIHRAPRPLLLPPLHPRCARSILQIGAWGRASSSPPLSPFLGPNSLKHRRKLWESVSTVELGLALCLPICRWTFGTTMTLRSFFFYVSKCSSSVSLLLQDPRSCSELRSAFQQSLVYWQNPSLPWIRLFPRINAEKNFTGKCTPWAHDVTLQQSLMSEWWGKGQRQKSVIYIYIVFGYLRSWLLLFLCSAQVGQSLVSLQSPEG